MNRLFEFAAPLAGGIKSAFVTQFNLGNNQGVG